MSARGRQPIHVADDRAGCGGFAMLYRDVLIHPAFSGLTRTGLLVYLYIATYTSARGAGPGRPGPEAQRWQLTTHAMASDLGASRSQVFRALKELTDAKLLVRSRTGGASFMRLVKPPAPKPTSAPAEASEPVPDTKLSPGQFGELRGMEAAIKRKLTAFEFGGLGLPEALWPSYEASPLLDQ